MQAFYNACHHSLWLTTKIGMMLFVTLFCTPIFGQGVTITAFQAPSNSDRWSVCDPNGSTFSIDSRALSNSTGVQMELELQSGMEYIPGTLSPAASSENVSNPNQPIFDLPNYSAGDLRVYTFKLKMDCQVISYLVEQENEANMVLQLSANEGNNTINTAEPPFTPFTNSVKIPFTILNPGVNNNPTVEINESFNRTFDIQQTGVNANLFALTVCMDYGSGISATNQQLNGVPVTLDASGCLDITTTNASILGITLPFGTNHSCTWSEDVQAITCSDLGTTGYVSWGCDDSYCQEEQLFMGLNIDINAPNITETVMTRTFGTCIEDGATINTVWQLNQGKISNLIFRTRRRENNTWVDPTSIEYNIGAGWQTANSGTFTNTSTSNTGANCIPTGERYTDLRFPVFVGEINAPSTFQLRYVIKTCCPDGNNCTEINGSILGASSYMYAKNSCGSDVSDEARISAISMDASTSDFVPTYMDNGDTQKWEYHLNNIPDLDLFDDSGNVCLDVQIGEGLTYIPGSIQWSDAIGNNPDNVTVIEETITNNPDGSSTTRVCFDQYYQDGSIIDFDVNYTCNPASCTSKSITTIMEVGWRFGDGSCTNNCLTTFLCEDAITVIDDCCGELPCTGICPLSTTVQRTCFGEPDNDNDGCVDVGGMIDESIIAINKAMLGDELAFECTATINIASDAGFTEFEYVYLDLTFPNLHQIGSTQLLQIEDASTGLTYTCDNVNVFPSANGMGINYYLVTSLIQGCGDIPIDFVYENGDQITLRGTFVNLHNPGCIQEQVLINMDWYASTIPSPVGTERLVCCIQRPGTYTQVGYEIELSQYQNNSYGCGGSEFGFEVDFCIGGGSYLSQPFPHEIRNFMLPSTSALKIPDGLTLDVLEIDRLRFTKVADGNFSTQSFIDVTHLATEADGHLLLNWEDFYTDCNDDFKPNGGYNIRFSGKFQGSCSAQRTLPRWYFEADMDYCSPVVPDETRRFDGNHNALINIIIPNLTAFTSVTTIQPIDETASFDFSIQETNGADAYNAWAVLQSPSGDQTSFSISRNGSIIDPVNNVYPLGTINRSNLKNYQLLTNYKDCAVDSLILYVGWDCDGIPNSAQQVIQGGLPCPVDTLVLYLNPRTGALQQEVLVQPTMPIKACEPLDFEFEITNVGAAELYEPVFELYLPYSMGIEILPGSEQACYPCNVNNSNYNYNIFTPSEIIFVPQGIKYIWNLEDLITDFDVTATEGWEGQSQSNAALTKLRIKFQAEVKCSFIGGDIIRLKTTSNTFCGERIQTLLQNSTQVVIIGQNVPYPSSLSLDIDAAIDGCATPGTTTIAGNIAFFGDTDGQDSIIIALPPAMEYQSILFNPNHVINTTPVINNLTNSTGANGFQELRWAINPNVPSLTNIPFQLEVTLDPDKVLCGDDNLILMRAIRASETTCDGQICNSSVQTGGTSKILDLIKDDFALTNFDLSVNCGMTELTINNLTIENEGITAINNSILVEFFYDADNSGDYSPADGFIGSVNNTSSIPVGGSVNLTPSTYSINPSQTCKIIARSTGCNCSAPEIKATSLEMENAGEDHIGCNSDLFTLGCGENLSASGFVYEWFGLDGAPVDSLANANDPNTTISYTHTNSSPRTLQYVLLTTHPSGVCNSVDTVSITFIGVETIDGGELKVCSNGDPQTLSGPTGFFDYQWVPTTGLSDPIDPNTTVVAPIGVVEYTLTYRDLTGCFQLYKESVRGVSCTDLELTKEVSTPTAVIGDIINYDIWIVNQGPNGASGVEIQDTLPTQLTYLSSNPDGQYDPATGIWTIPQVLLPNDTVRLTIYAQINSGGPIFNVAEINDMNEGDLDSTPGNDDPTEDDQDGVCTSAPINLACREIKTLEIPDEFMSYQWFFNGTAIPNATSNRIDITEPGDYNIEVDNGQCPYEQCCPFVVLEEPCANIGDYVWEDFNSDGIQNNNENGIEGVTVILYDNTTNLPIDTVYTDVNGAYVFEEIPTGDYYISFDPTTNTNGSGYQSTAANTGNGTNDSEADPTTGLTPTFSFDAATGDDLAHDAGFVPQGNIGDYVWADDNANGIQDPIESGVEGVEVVLYDSNTGLPVSTVFTDSDGLYLFENVPAGDYYIGFNPSTNTNNQAYSLTENSAGNGTNDSEADPLTNQTPTFSFDPNAGDDLTHDAGLVPAANIGDYVWNDANGNGLQDDGATAGIEGVQVVLYDNTTGLAIDTVFTDNNGQYLFENIPAGDYYINFNTDDLTGDYAFTANDNTGDDATDSDANAITGNTPVFTFFPTDGSNLSFDAGMITCPIQIANLNVSCQDFGCSSQTLVDFAVAWTNTITEDINVSVGVNNITIPVSTGATSPFNIQVNLPADGATQIPIIVASSTNSLCQEVQFIDATQTCDCASNRLLVDDFSNSTPLTVLNNISNNTNSITGNDILSGSRDITTFLTESQAPFNVQTTGDGSTGVFSYTEGGAVRGGFTLTYDGVSSTFDPTGLGGIDITVGGLLNVLALELSSDQNVDAVLEIYTDATNYSTFTQTLDNTNSLLIYEIPFNNFTATGGIGADFTNVGAIRLTVNTTGTNGDLDLLLHNFAFSCTTCGASPTASTDKVLTEINTLVTIPVQANDSDPNNQLLTTSIVSNPSNGTVTVTGSDIEYTPNTGFVGVDEFYYQIMNPAGATDQAKVTVIVSSCGTPTVIDAFDIGSPYTVMINTGSDYQTVSGLSIAGGERDIETFMTVADSDFNIFTYGDHTKGNFSYIEGGPVRGGFMLIYDGTDGDANTINHTGLAGLDLVTGNNDALDFHLNADNDLTLVIEIFTDAGNSSSYNLPVLGNSNENQTLTIPFAAFTDNAGTGADFTNVGAITLRVETTATAGNLDLNLYCILTGCSNNSDNDGDGIPDFNDPDDDNDGIPDWVEANCPSEASFGTATCPDPSGDSDGDGILNYQDANSCTLNAFGICPFYDTDNDGTPDFFDLDSDNDGIADWTEAGNAIPTFMDSDGDGIDDAHDADLGGVGLNNTPTDTDNDGTADYLDIDADNDCISDWVEAQNATPSGTDVDADGIDDAHDSDQLGAGLNTHPRDTDMDGLANYQDTDSDGDNIPDWEEAGFPEPLAADGNNDGLDNAHDPVWGATCLNESPTDTDMDGVEDYLDTDSDGDGILDDDECDMTPCEDTDEDGTPDFQDEDSDGDCIPDSVECPEGAPCTDTDMDGTPDFRDLDADNDGIIDNAECANCPICEDLDGDGIPDFQDTICNLVLTTPIISTNSPVCSNDSIYMFVQQVYTDYIQNNPNALIQYIWINTEGDTITIAGPSLTLAANDMEALPPFSVQVLLNDCKSSFSAPAAVDIHTQEALIANNTGPICTGTDVTLFASTIDGATYEWTAVGSTKVLSIESSFILTDVTTTADYQVIIQTEACGADTAYTTVTLGVDPSLTAIPASNGPLCEGDVLELSASTIIGGTYAWYDATGLISTDQNFSISGLTNGTYSYKLEIEKDGCVSNIAEITVVVNTPPIANPNANYKLNTDCSPSNLTLVSSPLGAMPYTFAWAGPNGFLSNVQNPVINNASAANNGSYTFTLTDANGCTFTDIVQVSGITNTVAQPQITSSGPACEGESIRISVDSYTGSAVTYTWTTPSGTTTNISGLNSNEIIIAPVNASIHNGDYTVEVNVDGCILQSSVYTVQTFGQPSAAPSATTAAVCDGGSFQLFANATSANTFEWIGPNGFVSNLENPVINDATIASNGDYTLTVFSANDCSVIESTTVTTVLSASETPTILVNAPNCDGEDIVLSTTATGSQFHWVGPLGSGTILTTIPNLSTTTNTTTINPGNPAYLSGLWSVQITDTNGCVSISEPVQVTINDVPTAIATSSENICEGEAATLSASTVEGATYNWYDSNNTLISTNQTETIDGLTVGTYTYQLEVVKLGCSSNRTSVTVTVNANPTAMPVANYTLNADCSPADLTLEANPSGTAPFTFNWTGPNGFLSSQENPTIANASTAYNGSYTVDISDQNACTTSTILEVSGIIDVVAQPLLTGSGPACAGGTITLTVNAYTGANIDYTWTTPNGVTNNITGLNSNQIVISPVNAAHEGAYSVQVLVDGCTLTSDVYAVNMFSSPTIAPSVAANAVCEGGAISLSANASNATTYQWTGPNGFSSTAQNPIINNASIQNNGTYTLLASNNSGCAASASVDVSTVSLTPTTPTVTATDEVCMNETISLAILENYTGSTITYEWTNGNGTAIGTTPTISLAANSANAISPFRVSVTIDGCDSAPSEPANVTIHDLPTAIATNAGAICPTGVAQLFANTIAGASYEWRVAGSVGIFSTEQNPVITGLQSDQTYELTVIANGCISNPVATTTIIVNDAPTLALTANYSLNSDCSPSDLQLNPNVTSTAVIATFAWTGPNGFTSNVQTPIIPNASSLNNGSYTVIVSDENGCSATASIEVTAIADAVPQPLISSTGPACDGESITLSIDAYSGSNVTYTWTTPNGTTNNIAGLNTNTIILNPVNNVTHEGAYTVEVQVDGCVISSDVYTVEVFDQPTANPSIANGATCAGGSIELLANATGAGTISYNWSGPNAFTSNVENPILNNVDESYNGQYTLVVANTNGCLVQTTVLVNNILSASETPTIAVNAPNCAGEDLVFTTSAVGSQFEWISPLGASTSTLALAGLTTNVNTTTLASDHPAYLSGDWSVRVTDANGCTATSNPIALTINPVPTAIAESNAPVCLGETVVLSTSEIANANYYWYNSANNLISTNASFNLDNLAAGTHTYTLEIEQNGCTSAPDVIDVVIFDQPIASPSALYILNPDCSPTNLNLNANVAGTAPFTFTWTGPNGFTSTQENPVIFNVTSTYNGSYLLEITDANACMQTASVEVAGINDTQPEPILSSSGPACEGESITLTVPAYSGTSVSYNWTTPNGTTLNIAGLNSNQIIVSPVVANIHLGDYAVEIIVDGCTLQSDVYSMTIFDTPTTAASINSIAVCENSPLELFANATGANTYTWTGPNGFTSNAQNPVIGITSIQNNGTYTLVVANQSGCTAQSSVDVSNIAPTPITPTITSPSEVCADDIINLAIQENYTGTTITYEWTNGNGTIIGTTPTISLAANSADAISPFTVQVTVDDCISERSQAANLLINALPEAIATNGGSICQGEDAQLFANPIAGATYEWRIVGSNEIISTQQNPIITDVQSTQTYELTVNANGCGAAMTATTIVIVYNLPTAMPTAIYTLQADCSPSDLSLSANAQAGSGTLATFQWTGPNGFTASVENPTIPNATSANNGTYTLSINNNHGCNTSASVEVTTISDQVAQPIINGSGPACIGESIVLSVQEYVGANVDYIWTTPTTQDITGLNTNQIVLSPVDGAVHEGTYSVQVLVDGCTLNSDTYTVQVFANPTAAPSASPATLCEGETLSLTANATNATSFLWENENGFTSIAENPSIANASVADNGTYTLTATSISGCVVTTSIEIDHIKATPTQPNITSNSPVCIDEIIQLSIQENYTGTTINYTWTNGAGTTVGTNSTLSLAANDGNAISPYRVQVTVDNCAALLSEASNVVVHQLPQAIATNAGDICPDAATQLFANTLAGATYEWRVAGTPTIISTAQNPTISPSTTTTYELTVRQNGCVSNPLSTTTINVFEVATVNPGANYQANVNCEAADLGLVANVTLANAAIANYAWSGPNGFSASVENPTIPNATANNNGTYTLVITDENACTATGSIQINSIVNTANQPLLTSSGPTCEGESITISVQQYQGSSVDYIWNVPSTANVTGLNTNQIVISPANAANHEGVYSVQVTVDGCVLNSDTYTLDIFETPTTSIAATSTPLCEGDPLRFFANADNVLSYAWTGPNGFTSNAANPEIANTTLDNNGTYTLTATSQSGCSITESITVQNIQATPTQPTITSNSPICNDEDIQLAIQQNYIGTNVTYVWTNGVGTSIGSTKDLTLATTNANAISPYRVQVSVGGCASDLSEAAAVLINQLPSTIATNSGGICANETAQLFANAISGASYTWTIDHTNELVSTEQNPMVNPSTTTTYQLVINVNGCVSEAPATTTVDVFDAPTASPSAAYTLNTDCSASNLQLKANAVSNLELTYNWAGPNGFSSNLENPTISNADQNDNGTYTLLVTDANGCTVASGTEVIGIADEVAQPIIASTGPTCEGESITINVQQYQGSTVDYIWNVPSTTDVTGLNTNQIVISPANAANHEGVYSVQVTVDGCILDSDTYTLDIFETPTTSIAATSTPLCEGDPLRFFANADNVLSYAWTGPNGFTSNAANPEIANTTLDNNGTYTLTATSQSGCSTTESITVQNIQATPTQPTITSNSPICNDEDIQLAIQQVYSSPMIAYVWTNGVGAIIGTESTITLATDNPAAISPYRVQVSVGNCGSAFSEPANVLVTQLPLTIATNSGNVCDNEATQLFANPLVGASYTWTIEGTNQIVSTEQSPMVNPTETTTYELVINLNGCLSETPATTTIEVFDAPTAMPTAIYTANGDCAPTNLELFANATIGSNANLSYNWTGPNGFASTLPNPIVSSASQVHNGTYTLVVTDENGCEDLGSTQITGIVDAIAQPVISSTGPDCENGTMMLSIEPYVGSVVTYTWTTPNGIETNIAGLNTHQIVISPINAALHNGNYVVQVNVDGCISNSAIYAVETYTTPQAVASVVNDLICGTDDIQLFAETAQSYLWNGPNGFTSVTQNPSIENANANNAGTYYLTVTNEQGCQSATTTLDIEVMAAPETPTLIVSAAICGGENIELSTSTPCDQYQWIGPGGASATTLANPLLTTTSANTSIPMSDEAYSGGMWSVICVNAAGCASELSNAVEVTINEVPQAANPSSSAYLICPNELVQLFAGDGYPSGTVFNWYDTDPSLGTASLISNQQNPMLSELNTAGVYTYWLTTSTNGCTSTASMVEITATQAPELLLVADNAECIEQNTNINLYANPIQGIAPYTYEWAGPNGFNSTDQIPTLPNANNDMTGTYTLTMTDANGCTAATSTVLDVTVIPSEPTIWGDNSLCLGESLSMTAPIYTGSEVHYEWIGPAGSTSGGDYPDANVLQINNIAAAAAGAYQVQIYVDGCASTLSAPLAVSLSDGPSVALTNNGVACASASADLELSSTISNGVAPFTYNWSGPNGFQSNSANPVMPNANSSISGTYSLIVTDANGCQSTPTSTVVEVTDLPATPTLFASENELCAGTDLLLNTQSYQGDEVDYVWTFADGSSDTTSLPALLIEEVSQDLHDGLLTVSVIVDGCDSEAATPIGLSVFDTPAMPAIANSAQEFQPACEGESVQLSTTLMPGVNYEWIGPNGFNSDLPNPSISNVSPVDTGLYYLVIEQNGCTSAAASTYVYVLPELTPPIVTNDGPDCEGNDVQLLVVNPQPELLYDWFRAIDDLYIGTGAVLILPSVGMSDAGGYYVIGNHELGCATGQSNITNLAVDQVAVESAYAGTDMLICNDTIMLGGNSLTDSEGMWMSLSEDDSAIILNPEQASTLVTNLSVGDNTFIWNVMSGACGITSSDTLVVTVSADVTAEDDLFILELNEQMDSTVILNDDYIDGQHTIGIIDMPQHGDIVLQSNGDFLYVPFENYIGTDQVIYEICMDACPDVCTEATLAFQIGTEAPCTIPTIMTPNGDGMNDAFIINCLTQYPNSRMCIFNRWGDAIFQSDNYQNDWEGTYKGENLPVGTYYYILELNDGNRTNYSGYIFIQR